MNLLKKQLALEKLWLYLHFRAHSWEKRSLQFSIWYLSVKKLRSSMLFAIYANKKLVSLSVQLRKMWRVWLAEQACTCLCVENVIKERHTKILILSSRVTLLSYLFNSRTKCSARTIIQTSSTLQANNVWIKTRDLLALIPLIYTHTNHLSNSSLID